MKRILSWIKRHFMISITIGLALILSLTIPLPYYIYQPGSADSVAARVTVAGGHKNEKGSLMLTTVLTTPVYNVYFWLYGKFAPNAELVPRQQATGDVSDSDYNKELTWMMNDSHSNAIISAMHYLKRPVQVEYQGVEIGPFAKGTKAKGLLQTGDIITALDGHSTQTAQALQQYLHEKHVGDRVVVQATRDGRSFQAPIQLIAIGQGTKGQPQSAGIGFQPLQVKSAIASDSIRFHTNDIGGPSAGLMFTLEIISQLTPGDLTKGYQIAGTGTISQDGRVGQIGGIEHKIVAATAAHADIFFVPKDIQSGDTNEKNAFAEAKRIHSTMKIIPVATLSDALNALQALPIKAARA